MKDEPPEASLPAVYIIRHAQAGPRHDYDKLSDLGRDQARRLGRPRVSREEIRLFTFNSVPHLSDEKQRSFR